MIKYVKQEISKDGFDGLDAKDVNFLNIMRSPLSINRIISYTARSTLHHFRCVEQHLQH